MIFLFFTNYTKLDHNKSKFGKYFFFLKENKYLRTLENQPQSMKYKICFRTKPNNI